MCMKVDNCRIMQSCYFIIFQNPNTQVLYEVNLGLSWPYFHTSYTTPRKIYAVSQKLNNISKKASPATTK